MLFWLIMMTRLVPHKPGKVLVLGVVAWSMFGGHIWSQRPRSRDRGLDIPEVLLFLRSALGTAAAAQLVGANIDRPRCVHSQLRTRRHGSARDLCDNPQNSTQRACETACVIHATNLFGRLFRP